MAHNMEDAGTHKVRGSFASSSATGPVIAGANLTWNGGLASSRSGRSYGLGPSFATGQVWRLLGLTQ